MKVDNVIDLALLMHLIELAFAFAFAKAGKSIPARMAMMAMTTRSSIRVKPRRIRDGWSPSVMATSGFSNIGLRNPHRVKGGVADRLQHLRFGGMPDELGEA
jgi:hypothetical protein